LLIVAGLAGSFFTLEGWLKGTRTWKRIGVQAAWVFVPVWLYAGGDGQWQNQAARMTAWEQTSLFDFYPIELMESNLKLRLKLEREDLWATLMIARLEKHRLVHGAYPEQLYDLDEGDQISSFGIRPGEFRYEPHGLPLPLVVASDFVLPAGQPVLFHDTSLGTRVPPLFTESERQARMKTLTGAMALETIEAQTQEVLNAAIRNSTGGQRVLWADGWDQYRRYARHGASPEVLDSLAHLPPKTDRVKYVRIGVGDMTPSGKSDSPEE